MAYQQQGAQWQGFQQQMSWQTQSTGISYLPIQLVKPIEIANDEFTWLRRRVEEISWPKRSQAGGWLT